MGDETASERIAAVRRFNRFYTRLTGALDEGLLGTPYALTEARVLYELGQRESTEVAELRRTLDLDAGYLSRVLARFDSDGVVARRRSHADRRRQLVSLTGQGRTVFERLERRTTEEIGSMLSRLDETEQQRLLAAMSTVHQLLDGPACVREVVLREPGPGDLGWVVARHGSSYAQEYGFDETFEALVARIVGDYAEHRDPARERAWIADVGGQPVGCVFCVRRDDDVAVLRLLLVDPDARGMGVGRRLVDACVGFARSAGYRRMVLWTNDVLAEARRIYERAGFVLVASEKHHSFGCDLVGQDWALDL